MVNLPRCEGGKGDGCEAMAEGSEFVRQLQQRSAEKYEERRKQALIGYNYRNFKDYFLFKNQILVIRPDGRFIAIDKKVRPMPVHVCVHVDQVMGVCLTTATHRRPTHNTQAYAQFEKEGKVEGEKWIAKEDPPAEYVDVLESSTDKAPMPVIE